MEPDYSGVNPLQLREARRRIEIINAYHRIQSPTVLDADRHSAELGLSRCRFYRLARTWRDHRDPTLLVKGASGPRNRDYGIDPTAAVISENVIAELGPSTDLIGVARVIEARCSREGVDPPSSATIWNYLQKARSQPRIIGGPPSIIVGRFWFPWHVSDAPLNSIPMVLAAVMLPERAILVHELSTDDWRPPSVGSLIVNMMQRNHGGAPPRELLLEDGDRRLASSVLAQSDAAKIPVWTKSAQRALARDFGDRLGGLPVMYQRSLVRRRTVTLNSDDAQDAILEAISRNNLERPVRTADFSLATEPKASPTRADQLKEPGQIPGRKRPAAAT